jgi:hypothetical protein
MIGFGFLMLLVGVLGQVRDILVQVWVQGLDMSPFSGDITEFPFKLCISTRLFRLSFEPHVFDGFHTLC